MKNLIILFLAMNCMTIHSAFQFSEVLAYGGKCPACQGSLNGCFSCGSTLKCYSCNHCWGCGKNGY